MSNKKDHIIVLTITTLLFLLGIFVGVTISKTRLSTLETTISEFKQNINSLQTIIMISNSINNSVSCSFQQIQINETQEKLEELSKKVVNYEVQSRVRTSDYKQLKKEYNNLRAEYWLMLEELRNKCNNDYTTILFIYQTENDCPECRDEGVILSHATINKSVYVIPIDINENVTLIKAISKAYNITKTPTIIINSSRIINGFINETTLLSII